MIIVLVGPTGSGKSRLAIELAEKMNGEIINGDAFQVYRGIEIATAAPSEEDKKKVPHHLYGFLEPDQSYDIFQYQSDLRNKLNEVLSRKKTAIIVGGSGLYIRSALYDYDLSLDTSHVDMSSYEKMDNHALHDVLEELDPEEARKIHENNRRRVLRSIEVCLANHGSKTEMLKEQKHEPIYQDCHFYELKRNRDDLYPLVEKRVDNMVEMGLVEQSTAAIRKYGKDAPAFKAIGIKEFFPYLEGNCSLEEAIASIKLNTRHYIKRQETFFRHQFHLEEIGGVEDIL